MKKLTTLLILTILGALIAQAQVAINTDGSDPDNSAMLDIKSSEKGLLIPRMTQAEIEGISSLANGLTVYNTDDCKFYVYSSCRSRWSEISFGVGTIIPGGSSCGTVTDIDGNTYNTALIGNQCWMKENLKTTTYNNGTSLPHYTSDYLWGFLTSGAYMITNLNYGNIYNWYAVDSPNGLCPIGWHVPSTAEWTELTDYIGGTGSPHGDELKSCRQIGSPLGVGCSTGEHPRWNQNDTHYGTDDYGFSCLPGGLRGGSSNYLGERGYWWSSTEVPPNYANHFNLNYYSSNIVISNSYKSAGISVRCIKD